MRKKGVNAAPTANPTEEEFWDFCELISVASRDTGVAPIDPWGTQKVLIHEIFEGIKNDVHQFFVLKAGQVGASTVMLLLNLFWYVRVAPGIQGVIVTDSDELREFFRDSFIGMLESLGQWKAESTEEQSLLRKNNKNMVAFRDGGRLLFQTSGARTGLRLGVGRGFALAHCSEVALWPRAASLTYLRTRFSDAHPKRILVLESTARGKNWFHDLWKTGAGKSDIRRIFLGWWQREDYSLKKDSDEFAQYWDKKLTRREQHWARELKRRYNVELKPEQWAFKRWYTSEKAGGNQRLSDQEMCTLPEDAFEATGESFLGFDLLKLCEKDVKRAPKAKYYRYEYGNVLEDSEARNTTELLADLRIWEEPEEAQAYVIAAVPAHSIVASCSTGCVSVWRAERDKLTQVAEFSSSSCGLQTFAWTCVHILGLYKVHRRSFILEVQGHGMAVLQELQRIQSSGWGMRSYDVAKARKVIGPIQHYMWRRPDSLGGGAALQQKSDSGTQSWVIRRLKDQIEHGAVEIRSKDLLDECERMRQMDDVFQSESENPEEHRLMCAALAVESWSKQIRPLFKKVQGESPAKSVMSRMMENIFAQLGG